MELRLSSSLAAVLAPDLHGLAWLLTYSVHAVLWAAAVSLLARWQPLPAALRHWAWKVALFAPFLTTLLAFAAWPHGGEGAATSLVRHVAVVELGDIGPQLDLFGTLALAASALGLLQFGVSAAVLRRRLAGRRQLLEGPLFEALQLVRARFARSSVRLSESAAVDSPLVLGGSEICVPVSALSALDYAELEAVFAHELAHLERGDGFWFPLVGLIQSACWLHPVTPWVCAQFRQSAELACDARCVQLTGQPRALALALTQLASRAVAAKRPQILPTMTQPHHGLVARVAQLTHVAAVVPRTPWQGRARLVVSLAVIAVACTGLCVRVADTRATASARASSASPRELEIEQEVRHAREMQRWLEEQRVNQ